MIDLVPYAFKMAEAVLSAAKEVTALERALYTEAIHNCAWLGALDARAPANDPRFIEALAAVRIEAHEAFLAGRLGDDEAIAVKAAKRGPVKTAKRLRLGTRDIPITVELTEADETSAAPEVTSQQVVLSQAVAYAVHQVSLMRTIAANRERVGDLLRDVQGGTRRKNLAAVEHAVRIALGQQHGSISPKAGTGTASSKGRVSRPGKGGSP